MEDVNGLLNSLSGYEPEIVKDVDFEPIKGAYEARVDSISRKTGTSERGNEFDFYSFNVQIVKTVEGDRGENRFLRKNYNMIQDEYSTPADNMKRLFNDLFTCGIAYDKSSEEALAQSLASAKDKLVNVRTWVKSDKNDLDKKYQQVKFVKEIKLKAKSGTAPF